MNEKTYSAPELVTSHWFNTPEPINLADLRGKVVIIEAFQMLCPGCVSHGLPQATRIRQTFSPDDVEVLGLHTVFEHHEAQGSKAALEAFLHEYRITFPVGIDAPSAQQNLPQTMAAYQLRGTPSLLLIDQQGQIRDQYFGSVSDMVIGAAIMQLIMETHRTHRRQASTKAKSMEPGCSDEGCAIDY